jgi:hypothetical protein
VSQPADVPSGQRVDFDTDASDGLDGFELQTTQSIIYLDVIVDGARMPSFIY